MTQELLERTTREWVHGNARRLPRALSGTRYAGILHPAQSAEEIADALIRLAGQMEIADTRVW